MVRVFEKGDVILVRAPGLLGNLEEAWSGPWEMVSKCGPVTYKKQSSAGKGKMVHL